MPPTRILSFDLDDTLWPVAPVIAAAEESLFSWLRERHPRAAHGHSVESMRALRARVADEFPAMNHDLTFLRRHALAQQFLASGHAESLADEAMEVFFTARNRVAVCGCSPGIDATACALPPVCGQQRQCRH